MKIANSLLTCLIFVSLNFNVCGQPSTYTTVALRLYSEKGEALSRETICSEYSFLDRHRVKFSCDEPRFGFYFNDSTHILFIGLGAIYAPFHLSIAHGSDTMSFITMGDWLIDSVAFQKGTFVVDHPVPCEEMEVVTFSPSYSRNFCKLSNIDWNECGRRFQELERVRQEEQDQSLIQAIITLFYMHYTTKIAMLNTWIRPVRDGNGVRLEYSTYLDQLRANYVSEEFINTETERLNTCGDILKTISWEEYARTNTQDLGEKYKSLHMPYWLFGYDSVSGVKVTEVSVKGEEALVKGSFYTRKGMEENLIEGATILIVLKRTGETWQITRITKT